MMQQNIDESLFKLVTLFYRGILGREPDAAGLQTYLEHLRSGRDLTWLLQQFIGSPESVARNFQQGFPLDTAPSMPLQTSYTAEDLTALWKHIESVWSKLGDVDPYWSVLTDERFRMPNMTSDEVLHEFYASGAGDGHRLQAWLDRNGLSIGQDAICAEYGCGVGRITRVLAGMFKRVIAFDISAPHLRMAEKYLRSQGVENVDYVLVRSAADLGGLKGVDFFYSMIVLQHNPPPIMLDILNHALGGLRKGGTAFFQIPTYSVDYSFSLENYWRDTAADNFMEMHFIPQKFIFDLAWEHAVIPLEVQPDACVGHHGEWASNTFLMQKIGDRARAGAPSEMLSSS